MRNTDEFKQLGHSLAGRWLFLFSRNIIIIRYNNYFFKQITKQINDENGRLEPEAAKNNIG